MAFFQGNETVTIKRRSASSTDEYGNKSWTLTTVVVKNCFLGFSGSGEPIDANRDPIDVRVTIYFPAGTVIADGDRFIVRNTEFVKDGSGDDWGHNNPLGLEAGVVVQVRKRNG